MSPIKKQLMWSVYHKLEDIMINLINTYVEMKKKLSEEYGIIGVSTVRAMPVVQVYELDKFVSNAGDHEIEVIRKDDDDYPYEASYTMNNLKFIKLLTQEDYEEIIKIEGVKHE